MKGERFDQKTGKWVPKPEEQEIAKVRDVNIDAHAKGSRFDPKTGEWLPIPGKTEADAASGAKAEILAAGGEADINVLREKASKLMKELSDPKVPVERAHKMWLEYMGIKEQLGEADDAPNAEKQPGNYL